MTIFCSSGTNITTPQVSGGDATGWRTGHLRRTDECVNGTLFNGFVFPKEGLTYLPVPVPIHFKLRLPISYARQPNVWQ